jgi:ATP-binding cassette subfamily B protein
MFHYFGGGDWWVYAWGDQEKKKQVTWPVIRRVLSYARPYWKLMALSLVTILITTGLGLLTPLLFRDLIDRALPNGDFQRLNILALGLIAIPIMTSLIGVFGRKINATIGEGVIFDLRSTLYGHLQQMSLRFFTNTKSGELMSRLNNDVVNAQSAVSDTIVDLIINIVTVIATFSVMLAIEWRLTIIGIAVLPIFVLVARRMGTRLRDIRREQMEYNAQMNAMMAETLNISGALLVKLFGHTKNETQRFRQRAGRVRDVGIKQAVVGSRFWVVVGMVGVIGTGLVYWLGGYLVLSHVFTIGTIVAFSSYLMQLYGPLQSLINAPMTFATSMVSFERVFEVIDLPVEIDEKPDAYALADVQGELVFDKVAFSYKIDPRLLLSDVKRRGRFDSVAAVFSIDEEAPKENGKPAPANGENRKEGEEASKPMSQAREMALENISFHIQSGQLVALVGPSGAGKTTITYLIPRLYDPTSGRILLDGHDLRDLTLDSLSDAIGMVTQETYLFHDTIRMNLQYANPHATQADIEAACKAANIHDFIVELADGYDTIVGERGYRLSGGEKQRIALARVILKDPRILVLDEATSSLDSQAEALIQEALKRVMAGRTSIVIAHRLSTILAADLILVMDRGQIIERGTHHELLAQSGLYAELYETQFKSQREMA